MRYRSIIIFLLLHAFTFATRAQTSKPVTDSVSALFSKFIQTNAGANPLLLTDRDIYLAGEKIWFKTYLVNARNGKSDLATKNLFADIVNEKDSIIQQLVLDNINLRTDGAFSLPESIPSGFYWIRCYTAAQLADDHNNIFIKPVYVLNKQLHDQSSYARHFENLAKNNEFKTSVHFYAERLTAIPGIISTGVVEIKNGYNNPLLIQGNLVNSKDSVITNFKTNDLGLARLTFVDDPSEKYTVVFYENDNEVKYQLPSVNKNSIQLSVTNQTAKTIKAFVTLEGDVRADAPTTILAVQHDSLYYAAVGTGTYGINIPIADFSGGIVRLLLFDEHNILVSERKIYIPKENVELSVKPDKKKYGARENVNVHIKLSDVNGQPLASSILNVAVQDELMQQLSDSMEAGTLPPAGDFLLADWLNKNHTKYAAGDIDLLMATRASVLQQPGEAINKEPIQYDDNSTLQNLTGKIVNKKGEGVSDRVITVIAKNTGQFFMDVDTTDKDGRFSISTPQGLDSLQLSLQVTDKHRRQTFDSIKIDSFHYPQLVTPLYLKQQFIASNISTLALLRKYHIDTATVFQGKGWLKPVIVTTTKKEELNYDASRRISFMSQIITSDKLRNNRGPDAIFNALLLVPGVNYMNGHISIFGPNIDMHGKITDPLIVLDGVPMPQGARGVEYPDPADIDFIEVLRGAEASIYGIDGGAGVISINTKHGPDNTNYSYGNMHLITPVMYHVSPGFEMPDYSKDSIKNSSNPDSRTTIYWDGNIATDANGEAAINFYTADNATNYMITITGLTTNGELVYKRVVVSNTGKSK